MILELTNEGAYRIKLSLSNTVNKVWVYSGAKTASEALEYAFWLVAREGTYNYKKLAVKCDC